MLRLMLCRDGYKRAQYLKKKKYFHLQGKHCYFAPFNFGTEPYLISFGDNVYVASGVKFVTHDIISAMIEYMEPDKKLANRLGKIVVGNNVFIGAGSTILYDVNIGNNVIIAAGSLVNHDIPDGCIYGGVPAVKIGSFDAYKRKCYEFSANVNWSNSDNKAESIEKQKFFFWKK